MTVQPGFTRFRLHRIGTQSAHGTPATPSIAVGLKGTPDIDPNWQDQSDVDTGSIDPVLPAYRTQTDITETLTGPLTYNLVPILLGSTVRGGITPTGATAKSWTHQALSTTVTTLDELTDEFSDDVLGDGLRMSDGICESLTLSFDESLGPWQVSAQYRFGKVLANITPTANLVVGSNLPLVFGADTILYLNDTSGAIGTTAVVDALHSATLTIANSIDQKRYANGSNSRFALSGYGLASRGITGSFVFAKSSAIVGALSSETVNWLNADPVNRYISMVATSPTIITGVTHYSWTQNLIGTWRKRTEGEMGGNSTVQFDFIGRLDSALGYAYKSVCVNTLAAMP